MTTSRHGGESERLAPVIPLFGGDAADARVSSASANQPPDEAGPRDPQPGSPTVFPGPSGREGGVGDLSWHPTWTEEPVDAAWEDDIATVVDDAEAALIKRLRTRSLSEREASQFLRERELGDAAIDHVIDRMRSLGYLDDSALAEQLVHSGVERKGQGRAMLVQTLSARGIPREVIDEALDALPDDDADRALEFARQKARTMRDLDRDTALRRLSGQLARRGYGASALTAARQALEELGRPVRRAPAGTVRFE
ncbi:RecX family transcriptional regulator [Microbacterium laevaniformans]|uniref:Regulatory protein RecX n=1 Tax=Microbacterium laevaniformans TaxID=36807 RepID=A0A4S2DB78_9MICO|nr:regulatory protein RecX [Microbacterium laevaniformans]TGY39077.1 RecX family transcriptional regulator [Microbacterium laevaniformans]